MAAWLVKVSVGPLGIILLLKSFFFLITLTASEHFGGK